MWRQKEIHMSWRRKHCQCPGRKRYICHGDVNIANVEEDVGYGHLNDSLGRRVAGHREGLAAASLTVREHGTWRDREMRSGDEVEDEVEAEVEVGR